MALHTVRVDELEVRDERPLRDMAVYAAIRRVLRADDFQFRVATDGENDWARVLFLNLTYWNAGEASDVLVDASIDADVLAHAGWHHAARKAMAPARAGRAATAAELFLGESVASAFDLYLVGWLVRSGKRSTFLKTQLPAMAAVAENAGVDRAAFAALIESVAADPARAFEDLRALLFDAAVALMACGGVDQAAGALQQLGTRRFISLLHHYELSNWVLYARAYGGTAGGNGLDEGVAVATDSALRAAPDSLVWLEKHWLS